jgi:preprotein translocase subunit SecG
MGFLAIVLLVVFVLICLLLIGLVMIQDDQGEGLGGIFGGTGSTSIGSRSGNILTKTTSIIGAVFLVTAFALAWINKTPEQGNVIGAAQEQAGGESAEWWNEPVQNEPQAEEQSIPSAETQQSTDTQQ